MTFQRLQHESLRRSTFDIIKTESFPALDDPSTIDFTTPLASLRATQTRLVILSCPGKYAERIFYNAYHLGMLTKGWVWFVSDAIAVQV